MQDVRDESVASIRDTSTTLLFVLDRRGRSWCIAGGVALLIALQRTVIGR